MKAREFITEDDFWGDYNHREPEVKDPGEFITNWADDKIGIPPANVRKDMWDDWRVELPRDQGPRITHNPILGAEMQWELRMMAEELIEELSSAGYGEYELGRISSFHFSIHKLEE